MVDIQKFSFVLPKSTPDGEYLVRVENLALHIATTDGRECCPSFALSPSSCGRLAEFYVSCAQVKVVEGGEGTPGPLVSIPGMYNGNVCWLSVWMHFVR